MTASNIMGDVMNDRSKTSAIPIIESGVKFECYRVGINMYRWSSEDQRMSVWRNYRKGTYRATLDGEYIGKRFLTERSAIHAVVAAAKRKGIT